MPFMFHTLKNKISALYIGLVSLTAVVGGVSILNVISLGKSVDGLMTRNYKSISAAGVLSSALDSQDKAAFAYLYGGGSQSIGDFYAAQRLFEQAYDIDAHNMTEPGEQAAVNAIRADHESLEKMFATLVAQSGRQAEARAYYSRNVEPNVADAKKQIQTLVSINQTAMFRSKNDTSRNAWLAAVLLMALSALAVTGGFLVSHYFVNRFLLPVKELSDGIRRVQGRNPGLRLNIRSSDEMGQLTEEFNEMTRRLEGYEKSTMGSLLGERNKTVTIVKSIGDPLVVLDCNFRITMLNLAAEEFFGVSQEAAVGRHFLDAIHNGELFDFLSQSPGETDARLQKLLYFGGREAFYYNAVVTRYADPEQEAPGYLLLMQNVTQLKHLEQAKADFMATVSHEFKTPLTSILMGSSLLLEGSLGALNPGQKEAVAAISEDGGRLSDFVSELLEISRLEAGKSVFHFGPCSLPEIAEASLRRFRDAAAAADIALQNRLDDSLPPATADPERISWVLGNLLSNALKYARAGGHIVVSARVQQEMLEVSVQDDGEGIPPEYLNRIFDRFVQVPGQDVEMRGTGLGLSVAKGIIEAHGGRIWAESEWKRGSVFRFTLPVYKNTAPKADAQPRGGQTHKEEDPS